MKKIITLCLSLCMTAALAAPAYALEYSIDAPNDYDFGMTPSMPSGDMMTCLFCRSIGRWWWERIRKSSLIFSKS